MCEGYLAIPRLDVGGVKCREQLWRIGHVQCDCGGIQMDICNNVGAVIPRHEFSYLLFSFCLIFATTIQCKGTHRTTYQCQTTSNHLRRLLLSQMIYQPTPTLSLSHLVSTHVPTDTSNSLSPLYPNNDFITHRLPILICHLFTQIINYFILSDHFLLFIISNKPIYSIYTPPSHLAGLILFS